MSLTVAEILPALIAAITMLIPIGGLVWKAATLSNKIDNNYNYIKNVEARVNETNTQLIQNINEFNERLGAIESTLAKIQGYLEAQNSK